MAELHSTDIARIILKYMVFFSKGCHLGSSCPPAKIMLLLIKTQLIVDQDLMTDVPMSCPLEWSTGGMYFDKGWA